MSTLDVVAEILREVAPRALKAREIAARSEGRLPTASKTPETVVSRDLAIDVRDRGTTSRFLRVDRGAFVLKEALPTALYNEFDGYAAAWTRNLIAAEEIAAGVVDERSIRDLKPADVASYRQFHAFSGIAIWSRALRDAGWSDSDPIHSGSCPCQPFSSAGKRGGESDDRHLWPEWFRLIRACGPPIVVGEQVASKDGYRWLDGVAHDFESIGYNFTATELSAAAVGAPHRRQRIYFVAFLGGRASRIVSSTARGNVEATASGSGLHALHARVEDETDAARALGDRHIIGSETTRSSDGMAYAGERGCEILSAARLHDRGQRWNDAARCSETDLRVSSGVSDAAGARSCDTQDAGADRGDAGESPETIEWRTARDLESERSGDVDATFAVRDAGSAGLQGGVPGTCRWDGTVRAGEVDGTGCDCIGAVGMGDAGFTRGGRDAGAVPRAQAAGEGERIEAGDLVDEPVAPSADDGIAGDADAVDAIDSVDTSLVRGATDAASGGAGSDYGFRPGDRIRFDGDPTWGGAVGGFWADDVEWIFCRPEPGHQDGRWRPAQSGNEPLATWNSADLGRTRSARLRCYGNAIVRPLARIFIESVIDAFTDTAQAAAIGTPSALALEPPDEVREDTHEGDAA